MILVGIAGGTGSGKTTLVNRIIQQMPMGMLILVPQDAYYKDNSHIPVEKRANINFDHPDSLDFDLLINQLKLLKSGQAIEQPKYSYISCTRSSETVSVHPAEVIVLEGILILTNPDLRELIDIKVYVDANQDDRLERIIQRDMEERGRTKEQVLRRYEITVKPMHYQFVEPSKDYADIIVSHGGENQEAINMLSSIIRGELQQ